MEQIIDNGSKHYIDFHYALVRTLSLVTFRKIPTIETKKCELKVTIENQSNNLNHKNPYKL
ncbi:hypothetical protein [Bacillus pseudomycoides]|uniref:hypothetical protein n=1 Tax=Bacillus pseudomycoides TaxID=64104 RepID=UPI002E22B86C|nr:hypothetical protein [Bacillus pseudomycoides]